MSTTQRLGFEIELAMPLEAAIGRATEALKAEAFGVLTRIDVHTTLREKLGAEFRPYAILGVCNPPLALRALSHDAQAGLLLPCNVTVEETSAGRSLVRIGDPVVTLSTGGMDRDAVMQGVAAEAREKLLRVVEAMRAGALDS